MKGPSVQLIPTQCPYFMACCATLGIELEKGTPGVSNTYSKDRKYERDSKGKLEPGQVSYHLAYNSFNPMAVAKVWLSPDSDMREWEAIPARLIACKTQDEWQSIADDIETLHAWAAVYHIREFVQKRFTVDSLIVSDNEKQCAEKLSGIADEMRGMRVRNGGLIAAKLSKICAPAMFAWVKAWIGNFRELRDAWEAARPSIKIDRGDAMPLVIPQGKDFAKLMKRWVK
jgi:hypothetical protein